MTRDTNDINQNLRKKGARDANRDPITKTPGAHPVGTGLGAAAGGAAGIAGGVAASAATGLATGTVLGGPVGAAVGLAAGAVVGGLAGKAVGEAANPTEDDGVTDAEVTGTSTLRNKRDGRDGTSRHL